MIPAPLYKKIVESVPILCVDVILTHQGKYVLVKRKTEPLKDEWWIVGGRALKGERTIDAARRKCIEEVGLNVKNLKMVGVYEDSYPKSSWGVPTSSVSIVYKGEVGNVVAVLNDTLSDLKLAEGLPNRFMKRFNKL